MMLWHLNRHELPEELVEMFGQEEKLLAESAPSQGRGRMWRGEVAGRTWLMKPYLRGGLIGKVLNNAHFSRVTFCRELDLTLTMEAEDLPVSRLRAVSGRGFLGWHRAYAWVQADPGMDAFTLWRQDRLGGEEGESRALELGRVLAVFFRKGFLHPDLNLGNLLLSADRGWVILDWRGGRHHQHPGRSALVGQLARLGRSGIKHIRESHWSAFLAFWSKVVEGAGDALGEEFPAANLLEESRRRLRNDLAGRSWMRGKSAPL